MKIFPSWFWGVLLAIKILWGPGVSSIAFGNTSQMGQFVFKIWNGQENRSWRFSDLSQQIGLVYFGYTRCLQSCPYALRKLELVMRELSPPERERFRPIFVTLDPLRDEPSAVQKFASHFLPTVSPLGTVLDSAQLRDLTQILNLKLQWIAGSDPSSEGILQHAKLFFVVDAHGKVLLSINTEMGVKAVTFSLRSILKN
jgi:protein SCO1/2